MQLTAQQLNRTTLQRQLLLDRARVSVPEAVTALVALQAQTPASPYLALWARVHRFDPADLDRAFVEGSVAKASLMRVTLHAVSASDYPVFYRAMESTLRAARLEDPARVTVGDMVWEADELVARIVEFTSVSRTTRELEDWLVGLTGARVPEVWRALRTISPLHHVGGNRPWSFAVSPSFVPAPATNPVPSAAECTAQLLLRYLQGFGPASAHDCAQFTMLRLSVVRAALAALGDQLVEHTGPGNERLFDTADGLIADADTVAPPRLLGMWDSTLLAYSERSRMLPADHRPWVIRRNGDVLPTLLVDGHVVGLWRVVPDGVEATAFTRLRRSAWTGLADEAAGLQALLVDRDPRVYGRYHHWWEKGVPIEERRILSG